jgi:hypothetical protein
MPQGDTFSHQIFCVYAQNVTDLVLSKMEFFQFPHIDMSRLGQGSPGSILDTFATWLISYEGRNPPIHKISPN